MQALFVHTDGKFKKPVGVFLLPNTFRWFDFPIFWPWPCLVKGIYIRNLHLYPKRSGLLVNGICYHHTLKKVNIVVTSYHFGIFKHLDYDSLFEGVNEW